VRISNDSNGAGSGPFSELLRLQTDFYTRLADETLRYLRRLQGAAAPAVPGTVLKPGTALRLEAAGAPGSSIELHLEVENRQRVHTAVTPLLSPLVDTSGVTWFPAVEATPPALLLSPEEVAQLTVHLPLPATIPAGTYHGALLLQGFREGAVAVIITITGQEATQTASTPSAPSTVSGPSRSKSRQNRGAARKKS
jgi:hypothetical protein